MGCARWRWVDDPAGLTQMVGLALAATPRVVPSSPFALMIHRSAVKARPQGAALQWEGVARRGKHNGRARWCVDRSPASTERRPPTERPSRARGVHGRPLKSRGLSEAAYNGDPQGALLEGAAPSAQARPQGAALQWFHSSHFALPARRGRAGGRAGLSEDDEGDAGEEAEHGGELFPAVAFAEPEQAAGETDEHAGAADGGDDRDEGLGVAQGPEV